MPLATPRASRAWATSASVPAHAETINVYDDHGGIVPDYDARWAALAARGRAPGLTVILAGDHPASEIYVRNNMYANEDVIGAVETFGGEAQCGAQQHQGR